MPIAAHDGAVSLSVERDALLLMNVNAEAVGISGRIVVVP